MTESAPIILVVDDEALQRDLLTQQLAQLGYGAPLLATDGIDALVQYELHADAIELIISDLLMPEMDGLVLMRHLSDRGYCGDIVLLSGLPEEITSSAGTLADAHGLNLLACLGKPCKLGQLRSTLGRMRRSSARPQQGASKQGLSPLRLTQALAADEFLPWYQPKIDLCTGRACGVEALARWPQADGSMIGPGEFVPALEAAGLIDSLFYRLMQQVARDTAHWRAQRLPVTASVNLSMDSALDLDMPERVREVVQRAGLQPADFVIEVTESQLMVERSVAMESLTRLSLMGFALSIDDFGTGYSSLVQLIDLPFHELKIDSRFVQRASIERKAQSVLRTAIALGTNLELHVVAEGVESAEQLALLRSFGCPVVQGFLYARPMPQADCTHWLQHQR